MTEVLSTASAPGKAILLGEHAVVYGKPAIAIPVSRLRVEVTVETYNAPTGDIWIDSPVIRLYKCVKDLPYENPLRMAVDLTLNACGHPSIPGIMIRINSALPIGGGMGSGAAVSCALVRALSNFACPNTLSLETTNDIVYEVEKIHHGNPSGVDNTVITYEKPILFRRGEPLESITVKQPIHLVLADTGIISATSSMVAGVRKRYDRDTTGYSKIFTTIEDLVTRSKKALEDGNIASLAESMNENHLLLQQIEVSSFALDRLVKTAFNAGALAAKLIGAGGGGNMIALCTPETEKTVSQALNNAGAVRVFSFTLAPGGDMI